jgi:hypothetical protein
MSEQESKPGKFHGLIIVTADFAALLGLTVEECEGLSIQELADKAFDRGYGIEISSRPSFDKMGRVTLSALPPEREERRQ